MISLISSVSCPREKRKQRNTGSALNLEQSFKDIIFYLSLVVNFTKQFSNIQASFSQVALVDEI